ncbi:hypothetical protein CkaCkLH20_11412 [Colletotrichum karsti]|uniref:DUF6604 domain-containing protein n=1 Tax=Colletotrichum karsti TaxID=1095194 RepID=A0A9P6HVQ2_9PEZI|nr:uncharacterized protein CkaCkLH20_11412 [Colletotrichum karsti]KAF9870995.1 hypothetical protein CkaCkLH20_11412 [Colletotrichum karsti]
MPNQNICVAYKRDTKYIAYWIVNTSNALIKTHKLLDDDGQPLQPNTTGQVTIPGILAMAKQIAKARPTPSIVFHLLQSVIGTRSSLLKVHQEVASRNPNTALKNSIPSHKLFVDTLSDVFKVLGGQDWQPNWNGEDFHPIDDSDAQGILFSSPYLHSAIEATSDGESDAESDAGPSKTQATSRRKQKKHGKGKKSKKGKKSTKQREATDTTANEAAVHVELEHCNIVGDDNAMFGDYLMAANAIATESAMLRCYLQDVWRAVAYEDYNSAVAAAQSNVAVSMIRQASVALFTGFSGEEPFAWVFHTLRSMTFKDSSSSGVDKHEWDVWMRTREPDGEDDGMTGGEVMDVTEQLMGYAFMDLTDFIDDFRKNRTGKPTKAMQSKLRGWDPYLDLASASPNQRLEWRHVYTINWLYDLVNHYTATAMAIMKKEQNTTPLQDFDWSTSGPCGKTTSLLGLTEFASFVTNLAMQKPDTTFDDKILPHHVFQLQCIIDSFSVSRGWAIDVFQGHVLEHPPDSFKSTRDIEVFLHGDKSRGRPGFVSGAENLKQALEKRYARHNKCTKYQTAALVIDALRVDLTFWLTATPRVASVVQPHSQFSTTDCKGIMKYSPWLCGVGLIDALDLTFRMTMYIWELIPEPTLLLVLYAPLARHNVAKNVEFFNNARTLFPDIFTAGWAMIPHPSEAAAIYTITYEKASSSSRRETEKNLVKPRRFFKTKSQLQVYGDADWNLDSIAEHELGIGSRLWSLHLSETKHHIDPATGKSKVEHTKLVNRLRQFLGFDDLVEVHIANTKMFARYFIETRSTGGGAHLSSRDGNIRPIYALDLKSRLLSQQCVPKAAMVDLIQLDIYDDVCGSCPQSGLDYMALTHQFILMFSYVEDKLCEMGSPLYHQMSERTPGFGDRMHFVDQFLSENSNHQDCVKVVNEMFQRSDIRLDDFRIWKQHHDEGEVTGEPKRAERSQECTVM